MLLHPLRCEADLERAAQVEVRFLLRGGLLS
jgi:hypothetical protein